MNAPQDFRAMTAETVGRDLLQALVLELKLLPDVWAKLSEKKQNDVIDRLRDRVESQIKMAVHVLASSGRTVVAGDLDQVTIKDGVKAVIKFSAAAPSLHELYDAQGKAAPAFCTQGKSTKIINLPPTEKMLAAGRKHAKSPNLAEAYEFFTGKKLEGAHNAAVDLAACKAVYYGIKKHPAVAA